MHYQFVVAAVALITLPYQTFAKPGLPASMPVTVGAQAELNACPSIGDGKAGIIVRAAPSSSARPVATLAKNHLIWICQTRADAKWFGVVHGPAALSRSKSGLPPACGVNEPIAKPTTYSGPCKSGWVAVDTVKMIAG